MKRFALFSIAALGLCAAPAAAQVPPPQSYHYVLPENAIRFRLGLFMPQAEGDYFDSVFTDFTGSSDDFEDWTFGIDYTHSLVPMLDIIAGGSYYESSQSQEYRDFVDSDGLPIVHDTSLQISNFDVGLRVKLAPEHLPDPPTAEKALKAAVREAAQELRSPRGAVGQRLGHRFVLAHAARCDLRNQCSIGTVRPPVLRDRLRVPLRPITGEGRQLFRHGFARPAGSGCGLILCRGSGAA